MLHVNLTFVVFLFFCTNCTCSICKFTGADALRMQIVQRTKDIAKVGFTRSTTQTEIWRILGYFPFWPIICLIREFMAIAAVCSIFLKKKALSQILAFHPYSMIVSCLFCSSEVWWGSGRGGPDPAFAPLFCENPASRTFFISFPNPAFLSHKNTLKVYKS